MLIDKEQGMRYVILANEDLSCETVAVEPPPSDNHYSYSQA